MFIAGLPQGQKKSGKTKKNEKSQEKSENLTKFEKTLDFVSFNLKKSLYLKDFE